MFVDNNTGFLAGRNWELLGIAEKVLKALSLEKVLKGLKRSFTEGGREGESHFMQFLEEELQEGSKRGGVGLANSVETQGVDLRQVGATEKARRKKRDVRFCLAMTNRVLWKNEFRVGARTWLRLGLVPARRCRRQAVGISPAG